MLVGGGAIVRRSGSAILTSRPSELADMASRGCRGISGQDAWRCAAPLAEPEDDDRDAVHVWCPAIELDRSSASGVTGRRRRDGNAQHRDPTRSVTTRRPINGAVTTGRRTERRFDSILRSWRGAAVLDLASLIDSLTWPSCSPGRSVALFAPSEDASAISATRCRAAGDPDRRGGLRHTS